MANRLFSMGHYAGRLLLVPFVLLLPIAAWGLSTLARWLAALAICVFIVLGIMSLFYGAIGHPTHFPFGLAAAWGVGLLLFVGVCSWVVEKLS